MTARGARSVDIATDWLAREPELPDHCVVHGRPAERRVTFSVRPNRQVPLARVSGWPLCDLCLRRRFLGLAAAGALLFGGLLAMIVGFLVGLAAENPEMSLLLPVVIGFVAVVVSPLPLRWSAIRRLTRAELTADGSAVRVADASPAFADQLPQPRTA